MSLIIALRKENTILIIADTQLTKKTKRAQQHYQDMVLKVVFKKQLAICFAGDLYLANQALKEWVQLKESSLEAAIEIFTTHTQQSENSLEFILVTVYKEKNKIIKITNGHSNEFETIAYIGNTAAFGQFRRTRETHKNEQTAMEDILNSTLYPDVSGFCIITTINSAAFEYPFRLTNNYGLQPFTTTSTSYVPVPLPIAENGQISTYISAMQSNGEQAGLSIYIAQNNMGIIFDSRENTFPEGVIITKTPFEFRNHCKQMGLDVWHGCIENAEIIDLLQIALNANDYPKAYDLMNELIINLELYSKAETISLTLTKSKVCIKLSKLDEALKHIETVLQLEDVPLFQNYKAQILILQNKIEEMIFFLEGKTNNIDQPDQLLLLQSLIIGYCLKGNNEKSNELAKIFYKKSIEFSCD